MKAEKGKERLGAFPYVIGGLAYVPLFGVLFGIVALIWGLATTRTGGRTLAFMGAGGIALTVVVYSGLFYFGFAYRGGVFDELRTDLARSTITSLVQAIEFHKTQNETYPESLQSLQRSLTEDSIVFVFDPTDVGLDAQPRYFFISSSAPITTICWGFAQMASHLRAMISTQISRLGRTAGLDC